MLFCGKGSLYILLLLQLFSVIYFYLRGTNLYPGEDKKLPLRKFSSRFRG
jgi:hypothetical protein